MPNSVSQKGEFSLSKLLLRERWAWTLLASLLTQKICEALLAYLAGRMCQGLVLGASIQLRRLAFKSALLLVLSYFSVMLGCVSICQLFHNLYFSYCCRCFDQLREGAIAFSSEVKRRTLTWLSGEAADVLHNASSSLVWFLSPWMGLLSMIAVVGGLLGLGWAGVVSGSALIALGMWYGFRGVLAQQSRQAQAARVRYTEAIEALWDPFFFGDLALGQEAWNLAGRSGERYLERSFRILFLRSILSFLPAFLTALALAGGGFRGIGPQARESYSAWLALLPELPHIFFGLRTVASGVSQWGHLSAQVQALGSFSQRLNVRLPQDLVDVKRLRVFDVMSGRDYPDDALRFAQAIGSGQLLSGRWRIFGGNGVGKTSCLLYIKQLCPEACLLTPGTVLFPGSDSSSTGEGHLGQILRMLARASNSPPRILLFDEWEANLDVAHCLRVDDALFRTARHHLVIEVRHRER